MELDPIAQTIIGTLAGLAVAAGPVLIVGGKIAMGVSSIMTAFQDWRQSLPARQLKQPD